MKLQTAALLVIALLMLIPCAIFLVDARNLELLTQRLYFLNLSASAVWVGAWAMIFAAGLPTLYFSNAYRRLLKHAGNLQRQQRLELDIRDRLAHRDFDGVLKQLADRQDGHALHFRALAHLGKDQPEEARMLLRQHFDTQGNVESGYLLAELSFGEARQTILEGLVSKGGKRAVRAKADLKPENEPNSDVSVL